MGPICDWNACQRRGDWRIIFGQMADQPPSPAKRGRPRVPEAEAGTNVSTWITRAQHDRLCAIARRTDTSVSKVVRALVARGLR